MIFLTILELDSDGITLITPSEQQSQTLLEEQDAINYVSSLMEYDNENVELSYFYNSLSPGLTFHEAVCVPVKKENLPGRILLHCFIQL